MRPAIVWFRDDLRLADNPALHAAAHSHRPLVCIYIHDEQTRGLRCAGSAAELARLPSRLIHKPWAAKAEQLAAAGVRLGKTHPRPIVDHDKARLRALRNVKSLT